MYPAAAARVGFDGYAPGDPAPLFGEEHGPGPPPDISSKCYARAVVRVRARPELCSFSEAFEFFPAYYPHERRKIEQHMRERHVRPEPVGGQPESKPFEHRAPYIFRKFRIILSPVFPLFSGWNWQPTSGPSWMAAVTTHPS